MFLALASAPLSAEQARAESIGYQALAYVGKRLPLQVLCSAAGHYIRNRRCGRPGLARVGQLLPLAPRRRARPANGPLAAAPQPVMSNHLETMS